MKRTPWFFMKTKPVRKGAYEVLMVEYTEARYSPFMWTWDGRFWRLPSGLIISPFAGDKWRGLTEPAN